MHHALSCDINRSFGIDCSAERHDRLQITGHARLAAFFEVTPLAALSVGLAGMMLSRVAAGAREQAAAVVVDQRLASLWFDHSLHPSGWTPPPIWDPIAGDYRAKDGWIRLHTNASHHRAAALGVLGVSADRDAVVEAVAAVEAETLETAIIEAGGCAARMRSLESWVAHPQGKAVAAEPLAIWQEHQAVDWPEISQGGNQPLQGLRVLDLTRVIAGPVATRFLAAFGAEVLRIDPPGWHEAFGEREMTLGKRCAHLDLKVGDARARFEQLLARADVLVHGYRADALMRLGYSDEVRRSLNPKLIDVGLNAYGWSGPWVDRRGFDSLVQMSSGIAAYGMEQAGADRPIPLPVQALDHATGYFMAAAILYALERRQREGKVLSARFSLARTAHLLAMTRHHRSFDGDSAAPFDITDADLDPWCEQTKWGPAQRLRLPLSIAGIQPVWHHPAAPLGSAAAAWTGEG